MNKKIYRFVILLLLGSIYMSCGSTKDLAYYQDATEFEQSAAFLPDSAFYDLKIKSNDNLLITVSSRNTDAVEEFNQISMDRGSSSSANLEWRGYLVDEMGYINFPSIGKLYVRGMSKDQLSSTIEERLKPLFADPVIVNVRFMNYKITVTGEVARPGVYTIKDEKVTIPQALALAGDMTIYGKRDNVLICRVEDGIKQFHTVNMKDPAIFNSPYYYLQQNDMIYVTPNKTRAAQANDNQVRTTIISVTSLLLTLATFVYTITK